MLRRPIFWIILTLVLSFALFAYPLYVIRPFRYQGPTELAAALTVLRLRPLPQFAMACFAVLCVALSWPNRTALVRVFGAIATALVIACTVLSHVNVYELMFHPLDRPEFAPSSQVKLDGGEEVISVVLNNAARAYPIRGISYHHIVNDSLGGVPIVATY